MEEDSPKSTNEEENLIRSKKHCKNCHVESGPSGGNGGTPCQSSYSDRIRGSQGVGFMDVEDLEEKDEDVSDDDISKNIEDTSWFSM